MPPLVAAASESSETILQHDSRTLNGRRERTDIGIAVIPADIGAVHGCRLTFGN